MVSPATDLVLDLDSTLWPLLDAMDRLLAHGHVGLPGPGHLSYHSVPSWDSLVEMCGGLQPMIDLIHATGDHKVLQAIGLFPGVRGGVDAFRRAGRRLHIWSDRPAEHESEIRRGLSLLQLPYDSLLIRPRFDKVAEMQKRGFNEIIDDKPDTILQAAAQGMRVGALRFRYNQEAIQQSGAIAAEDWSELPDLFLGRS